jgi:hypothetical protein
VVANISAEVMVVCDCRFKMLPHPFGGCFRTEKVFPHVIVNANNMHAFAGKMSDRLRANQTG